jgi:hypothetical protein
MASTGFVVRLQADRSVPHLTNPAFYRVLREATLSVEVKSKSLARATVEPRVRCAGPRHRESVTQPSVATANRDMRLAASERAIG